jgi:hypothetical protein
LKIGVCGIACEMCPRMIRGTCPNGVEGCVAKENPFCQISSCAYSKGVKLCFACSYFPCETTKSGPVSYNYCKYIADKTE